jgi:hypothetical protein
MNWARGTRIKIPEKILRPRPNIGILRHEPPSLPVQFSTLKICVYLRSIRLSVVREPRRREATAESPRLEAVGKPEKVGSALPGLHPEIVMAQGNGVHSSLVPPVQDFDDLVPLPQVQKRPGAFLPLVPGVAFHPNLFKDPFFLHFYSLATEITENTEKSRIKDLLLGSDL